MRDGEDGQDVYVKDDVEVWKDGQKDYLLRGEEATRTGVDGMLGEADEPRYTVYTENWGALRPRQL